MDTLRKEPLSEREKLIVQLHEGEGLTYAEVARQQRCSMGNIRTLYGNAKKKLAEFAKNGPGSFHLLPTRVRTALEYNLGITSRTALRAAIESGRLRWDQHYLVDGKKGRSIRNAGWKSWQIMNEWVGLPRPERERFITCPHCGGKIGV